MSVAEDREVLPAHDGFPLAATRFSSGGPPRATVVVANAMGAPQGFYAPFARYLASEGIRVTTFDYRGTFASRAGPLRGFEADVMTWALQDLDAVLGHAASRDPGVPLRYLGHSLGGQVLGLLPNAHRVDRAITVTAGSGWYRYNDRMPLRVRILWFGAIPALTPLFGYFPGKALRIVGDLPAGVARQWRSWCVHPDYLHREGPHVARAFERLAIPIVGYSFEDDPMITRVAVDDLHRRYPSADVERRHVAPADVGLRSIGHFGFFSGRARSTLWPQAVEFLQGG